MTALDRFQNYISKDKASGCWLWTGGRKATGYGIFGIKSGKAVRAHKFAYENYIGPVPVGAEVCHKCDVRHCVNPGHLFLGTHQENVADMCRKNRNAFGERAAKAKLTWVAVGEIRGLLRAGWLQADIAAAYGVDASIVSDIKREKIWKPEKLAALAA